MLARGFLPYTLDEFVSDLRVFGRPPATPTQIMRRVRPLALSLAADTRWLTEQHYVCDAEQGFGVHLLHEEPDHSLAVFAISWLPGRGAPPHDHGTWAVVAGVDGAERNTFWRRLDDGSRDEYAELHTGGSCMLGPGQALCLAPGAIHSVDNLSEHVTVSLHVYGRHLNYTGRSLFDPQERTQRPFLLRVD